MSHVAVGYQRRFSFGRGSGSARSNRWKRDHVILDRWLLRVSHFRQIRVAQYSSRQTARSFSLTAK